MPKVAAELTAIEVKNLSVGAHAVGGVPGLHLNVTATGGKTWILRVRVGNKRREFGLGGFPGVTLANVKIKARELREAISQGRDPAAERASARATLKATQAAAKTFKECGICYINDKKDEWKNAKHQAQWLSTLEMYAFPILGHLDVSHIELPHILDVLNQEQKKGAAKGKFWEIKTETATRVRGRMESILDWATTHQHRQGLNPARWKGYLETLLKDPCKLKKVKHHAALDVDAISGFASALRQQAGTGARALEFAMLTVCRSGEVRGATWSEVDKEQRVWIIPVERMKAGKEHRVPLSSQALQLLEGLTRDAQNPLVFPAKRGGMLSDMTLIAVMRRMNADAVPHGFRSTFRNWAADRTNFSRDLCEFALAHTLDNKTEAAYLRTDMLNKRRKLMQAWADHCDQTGSATVIPISHKKMGT